MSTRQKRQTVLPSLIVPAVCCAILGYFAYHAQTGRYSVHTKKEMDKQATLLEHVLADTRAERERLERKVAQLRDGSREKDAVDEIARQQLGLAGENEFVILYH